jgi:hypothetical protein
VGDALLSQCGGEKHTLRRWQYSVRTVPATVVRTQPCQVGSWVGMCATIPPPFPVLPTSTSCLVGAPPAANSSTPSWRTRHAQLSAKYCGVAAGAEGASEGISRLSDIVPWVQLFGECSVFCPTVCTPGMIRARRATRRPSGLPLGRAPPGACQTSGAAGF